jgi:hypothetical protein
MFMYNTGGARTGKPVRVIRGSAQGDLNATWTYDNEGIYAISPEYLHSDIGRNYWNRD